MTSLLIRRVDDVRREGEVRVRQLQDKLNETVNDYEYRIHAMQSEMSLLEDELEIQNRSMKRKAHCT